MSTRSVRVTELESHPLPPHATPVPSDFRPTQALTPQLMSTRSVRSTELASPPWPERPHAFPVVAGGPPKVGCPDGSADGWLVSVVDGIVDGIVDGWRLGLEDGPLLGIVDGIVDGWRVGSLDGPLLFFYIYIT